MWTQRAHKIQPAKNKSRAQELLEVKEEGKASVVHGGLSTGCCVDVCHDVDGQCQRWKCSVGLWREEQKKYKHKMPRAIVGSTRHAVIWRHAQSKWPQCRKLPKQWSQPWKSFWFSLPPPSEVEETRGWGWLTSFQSSWILFSFFL